MKTKMITGSSILLLALAFCIQSCGSGETKESKTDSTSIDTTQASTTAGADSTAITHDSAVSDTGGRNVQTRPPQK